MCVCVCVTLSALYFWACTSADGERPVCVCSPAANPLIGQVAREIIRHGGSALLAETPELIGAEPYVLKNVKSPEVAKGEAHTHTKAPHTQSRTRITHISATHTFSLSHTHA